MKILHRTRTGNGYGCSCCAYETEDADWEDEKEMKPFSEILDIVFNKGWNADKYYTLLEDIYEKNGEVLYGYRIKYNKRREDIFIHIGNEKHLAFMEYDPKTHGGKTRAEIETLWEQHLGKQENTKWDAHLPVKEPV